MPANAGWLLSRIGNPTRTDTDRSVGAIVRRLPDWIGDRADVVYDVGGNVGMFAQAMVTRWPRLELVSFEPQPECAEQNEARAAGRWQVVRTPLGSRDEELDFLANIGDSLASSFRHPGPVRGRDFGVVDQLERRRVRVRVLDELVAEDRRPCFVKVDVEGFELEVLQGAARTLDRAVAVLVEVQNDPECFEGSPSVLEVVEWLDLHHRAFRLARILDVLCAPKTGRPLQWDGLFLPASPPEGAS
jgi:FkbM family methyltransferase